MRRLAVAGYRGKERPGRTGDNAFFSSWRSSSPASSRLLLLSNSSSTSRSTSATQHADRFTLYTYFVLRRWFLFLRSSSSSLARGAGEKLYHLKC